jgi:hypothetical protein
MPFVFSLLYPKATPKLPSRTVASKLTASYSVSSSVMMPIVTQQALAALANRNCTFLSDISENDGPLGFETRVNIPPYVVESFAREFQYMVDRQHPISGKKVVGLGWKFHNSHV